MISHQIYFSDMKLKRQFRIRDYKKKDINLTYNVLMLNLASKIRPK